MSEKSNINPQINNTEAAYAPMLSRNYDMLYGHLNLKIHVICFVDFYMQGHEMDSKYMYRKMTVAESLNYFQGVIFGNLLHKKEDFVSYCEKYNITFLPN